MVMDKLKVGVLIDENSLPTEGGGYAYYQALVKAIDVFTFDTEIEIVNVIFSKKVSKELLFTKPVIIVKKVQLVLSVTLLLMSCTGYGFAL